MVASEWVSLSLYLLALALISPLLGYFMALVFEGKFKIFLPLEKLFYRMAGVDQNREMGWSEYALSVLLFNMMGFLLLLFLLLGQHFLPWNPQKIPGMEFWTAFNTAISFTTNTNWQAYIGEKSLSYFSQMMGLTVQNFLSAGTGICVLLALIRGLRQKQNPYLGNFWVDLVRCCFYVLLPLSFALALLLMHQGVIQNLQGAMEITGLEGLKQWIPMGPVASQAAIKQLGTNGGGFFGANSAHPLENPTALSNFFQCVAILLIPASLLFTFGAMLNRKKHGLSLLFTMTTLFLVGLGVSLVSEMTTANSFFPGPLMEGKEVRFGVFESVLWSVATTAASNGSVNAMVSSLSPLAGLVSLANILTGEVVFGGVGSGLYGLLMYVILTVFIAGLMVGRSPEYLGKKIEQQEVTWALAAILIPSGLVLVGTPLALIGEWGLSSLSQKGPHGLSEALYAFASAANNNGSAFAGFKADRPVMNGLLGFFMLTGRVVVIFAALKIAGQMALKKSIPPTLGTFPTEGPLFIFLLISIIFILGALTFFPALTLGPLAEHLLMKAGITF